MRPLTNAELQDFAGPSPSDDEFKAVWRYRHAAISGLRDASIPSKWALRQVKAILGYHSTTWHVEGITGLALERLAGPDGRYTCDSAGLGLTRAHLYPCSKLAEDLLLSHDMSVEDMIAYAWPRDATVISCTSGPINENKMMEDTCTVSAEYFINNVIPFGGGPTSPRPFRDNGTSFTYGKLERGILRSIDGMRRKVGA